MIKLLAVVVLLAACGSGGDKCAKVYDKLAPVMEKMGGEGKKPDRDKMIGECKEKIKDHPERAAEMDCILAIDGEVTMDKLMGCSKRKTDSANAGGKDGFKDYADKSKATEAKLQLNKIAKSAKVAFIADGKFPAGSAPLTPAIDCCKAEGGKCAVDATAWKAGSRLLGQVADVHPEGQPRRRRQPEDRAAGTLIRRAAGPCRTSASCGWGRRAARRRGSGARTRSRTRGNRRRTAWSSPRRTCGGSGRRACSLAWRESSPRARRDV
jgi:hypothetical protein